MSGLADHLRNKFLAGILAAGPIVILVVGALWIEEHTRVLTQPLGFHFPGLGFLVALVAVYLLGLLVTSLLGRLLLGLVDSILSRVPGFKLLYRAWKEILVVAPEKAGMFDKVVLVPNAGVGVQLGFTNGTSLPGDPNSICVLLPGVPNPIAGRLVLMPRESCLVLALPIEEAFKFLLSTGNYVPPALQGVITRPEVA